jgi:hypothetical protein
VRAPEPREALISNLGAWLILFAITITSRDTIYRLVSSTKSCGVQLSGF